MESPLKLRIWEIMGNPSAKPVVATLFPLGLLPWHPIGPGSDPCPAPNSFQAPFVSTAPLCASPADTRIIL